MPGIIAFSRILPPFWWVIGIIGNIIALLVWLQPKMRHSSGYYLAALAIADLCFLPHSIIYEVNYTYRKPILDQPVLCEWFVMSYLSVQYMSPVFVLAFTVERYLSVCHPFRMVNFNQSNSKVTLMCIAGLSAFCVAINGVQGYFWTTDHGPDKQAICNIRDEIGTSGIWTIWSWIAEGLIFAAVPITVLILNILVIVEVRNISRLERRNMRTNSIDRRSTTVMLLGVSFYQIFTVLPATVVYVLFYQYIAPGNGKEYYSDDEIRSDPEWQSHLHYIGARIIIQNVCMSHYAANFFIYLLTGKIFRKQLREMMFLFCCKEKLRYLATRTISTRTTRMSLTSHRISISNKGRAGTQSRTADPCNNDTELGNKNSYYSQAELETMEPSSCHPQRQLSAQSRLLTCVEESDISDRDEYSEHDA